MLISNIEVRVLKIYHLNCGIITGLKYQDEHLICHCLLLELPNDHLVLVDTGLAEQDLIAPQRRFGFGFTHVYARPERDTYLSAKEQIRKLGFQIEDVKDIIMTHLDLDHVGGLIDFPNARVHVHEIEYETVIKNRKGLKTKLRYPQKMFTHQPNFITYNEQGESWKNFSAIRDLQGLPPEILLVPTTGHSRGHSAVAIKTADSWLIHAGDCYFDPNEIHTLGGQAEPQLERFEWVNQWNSALRKQNQYQLNELLVKHPEVAIFCAHNPKELHQLQNSSQLEKQKIISHPSLF